MGTRLIARVGVCLRSVNGPYMLEIVKTVVSMRMVTGQLADTPTRGLPTRGLDDSWTGHLADWLTRGLDNSCTGQVADWTTRGCHCQLCVLSFRSFGCMRDRDLSSPRVD